MIQITDLKFCYPSGQFDLTIPELTIAPQRATAVVGPSGSGKTTLLHLIAGILTPDDGTITIGDVAVSQLADVERRRFRLSDVGMVFQEFELIEYLNVLDNVLLPCRLGNAVELTIDIRNRAKGLLEEVGLGDQMFKSVTHLSQGERQRVAICRALLAKPTLILADEPTGNLDPATSTHILNLLLQSVQNEKATLIMVTHDHSLLDRFDNTVDFSQYLSAAGDGAIAKAAAQ